MVKSEAQLGQLLVAVSLLEQAKVLEASEAEKARERITDLSKKIAKLSQRTLAAAGRRRGPQPFLESLADDAPIFKVLQKGTLRRLSNRKGKLLMLLFNNQQRVVTQKELSMEGWGKENAKNSLNARITELRNVVEPYIVIDAVRNDGFQLRVVSNEPAVEEKPQ